MLSCGPDEHLILARPKDLLKESEDSDAGWRYCDHGCCAEQSQVLIKCFDRPLRPRNVLIMLRAHAHQGPNKAAAPPPRRRLSSLINAWSPHNMIHGIAGH